MINLTDLYFDGSSGFHIPDHIKTNLINAINELEWEPDPEKNFKRIPKGSNDGIKLDNYSKLKGLEKARFVQEANTQRLNNIPKSIHNIIENILSSHELSPIMNNVKQIIPMIAIWDGAYDVNWHNDVVDNCDFLGIIYITDHDNWLDGVNGGLETGLVIGELGTTTDLYDSSFIIPKNKYKPDNGFCVIINNKNPFFVHRAISLKDEKMKRITISFGFSPYY